MNKEVNKDLEVQRKSLELITKSAREFPASVAFQGVDWYVACRFDSSLTPDDVMNAFLQKNRIENSRRDVEHDGFWMEDFVNGMHDRLVGPDAPIPRLNSGQIVSVLDSIRNFANQLFVATNETAVTKTPEQIGNFAKQLFEEYKPKITAARQAQTNAPVIEEEYMEKLKQFIQTDPTASSSRPNES